MLQIDSKIATPKTIGFGHRNAVRAAPGQRHFQYILTVGQPIFLLFTAIRIVVIRGRTAARHQTRLGDKKIGRINAQQRKRLIRLIERYWILAQADAHQTAANRIDLGGVLIGNHPDTLGASASADFGGRFAVGRQRRCGGRDRHVVWRCRRRRVAGLTRRCGRRFAGHRR